MVVPPGVALRPLVKVPRVGVLALLPPQPLAPAVVGVAGLEFEMLVLEPPPRL
eukprot:CAMPEP_0172052630 /NCGR_PEP_ID=MMETSP1043-20130122/3762_1 /TAXON_ID=464988 /ORGANISM="Hemiselmis andersenii, Strain CCMP441" /LENGTH=52 /DNA_ID=CAMNT_0012711799 /DNA_START=394 /DNA_END=549 /DNA_ORIENTATION=+